MNDRFEKISAVEQASIIHAARTEFAEKGYRRASTNAIIERAGIPKGTLFYFFGNKKNLFLYLLDGAVEEYIAFVDADQTDLPNELFERLLIREQIKLRFAAENPLLFRFFSSVFLDIPDEIKADMAVRFKKYSAASSFDIMDGIDLTRFREGIDEREAVQMIHVLLEGVFARYTPVLKAAKVEEFDGIIKKISKECRIYFEMLKNGIYR